jgi:Ca-activated chloride channel family protein
MPTWSLPTLAHPEYGWALLCVPVVFFAWVYGRRQRRKVLEQWNDAYALPVLRRRGRWLLLGILLALCYALMGPSVGKASLTPTTEARDLFLAIDISLSMLAEDQPPTNRLQRAQAAANELLRWLRTQKAPCRVGLIAFAGAARIVSPPTSDLLHVEQLVARLHPESLGPAGRLGDQTLLGTSFQAVERVLEQWALSQPEAVPYTEVLVLSDGDDLNSTVNETRLPYRMHAWAVGDAKQGWPIPQGTGFLMTSNGTSQRVLTQQHAERLQQWLASKGTVLVEDGTPQPLVLWWQHQQSGEVRPLQSQARLVPIDRTHWFLALAGLLLLAEAWWGGARVQRW